MTTPKKSIKKGPIDEVEDRDIKKSFLDDEDDDFDVSLDDLDTFTDFVDEEDDDTY